jgi:exopolyphosphatase/guanosine-5'-triphosphate,3'-diphosphate pyrophosphatase
VGGIHLKLPRYDRRRVDGMWMRDEHVTDVIDGLLDTPFDRRALNPCIGRDRADLVLAGCAILEAIRRAFPADRLRIADRGLREGILMNLMREDGVWRRGGRP